MYIPYVNLVSQHVSIKKELLNAISGVIESGQFILGKEVDEFESRFAKLCGTRYAISVNSGTDALILALRSLAIGPGDEVITVPNSFISSTSCIMLVGAKPVFVDVRHDYNMDPEKIEQAITDRTRVILPVHLTGRPAEMDSIMNIAEKYRLHVVEDSAQAVLAEYKGKRVGSFGRVNCFSLHPLKTLNACGDGGVITTNDESLYKKIKVLRNIGLRTRDDCVEWSGNSRLDNLQAAILLVKLKYLEEWTEKRQLNAKYYQNHLDKIDGIICPLDKEYEKAVYHTFVIMAERRDELKEYLKAKHIETSIHYPIPIHLQSVASNLGYQAGDFPLTELQAEKILSLPVYQGLEENDLTYIVEKIYEFYKIH